MSVQPLTDQEVDHAMTARRRLENLPYSEQDPTEFALRVAEAQAHATLSIAESLAKIVRRGIGVEVKR